MDIHKQLDRVIIILAIIFFVSSLFFTYKIENSQNRIKSISESLTVGESTDKGKILAILAYVQKINAMPVESLTLNDFRSMSIDKAFWALFYRLSPKNIIPPDVVIDYKLGYTGPCGAQSRLFCSMVKSIDYECRLISMPSHTLTEVKINGIWTPFGPTFGTFFEDENGSFVPTDMVRNDTQFFSQVVLKCNPNYPINDTGFFFENPKPKDDIKDRLVDTIFYMEPYYFLSAISIGLLILTISAHIFINRRKRARKS
jgi:hypothetical protein